MKNVIIGVTGGIAAYKSCDLVIGLRSIGCDTRVIMTQHAKEFITPMTLATLSQHPVMDNMWVERNGKVEHIDTAKWTQIFLVYPATANMIAKFANGIADDLLSTVFLALPRDVKKIIFPAMNTNMLEHPATVDNLKRLESFGNTLVAETKDGMLACGDKGKGCLVSPRDAIAIMRDFVGEI